MAFLWWNNFGGHLEESCLEKNWGGGESIFKKHGVSLDKITRSVQGRWQPCFGEAGHIKDKALLQSCFLRVKVE